MYTTWENKYKLLPGFGDMVSNGNSGDFSLAVTACPIRPIENPRFGLPSRIYDFFRIMISLPERQRPSDGGIDHAGA